MGTPFLVKWKMAVVRGNLFACSRWRSWLCGLGPLYSCRTSKWMLSFSALSVSFLLSWKLGKLLHCKFYEQKCWLKEMNMTVWRSFGYHWTRWGHNNSGDWLFDTWVKKVMWLCNPSNSPVTQKSGKMLIHLYSPSNQVPTQNPGQAFHYQSKGEVIFTSWLTFKGLTLSDSCAEY